MKGADGGEVISASFVDIGRLMAVVISLGVCCAERRFGLTLERAFHSDGWESIRFVGALVLMRVVLLFDAWNETLQEWEAHEDGGIDTWRVLQQTRDLLASRPHSRFPICSSPQKSTVDFSICDELATDVVFLPRELK